MGMCAVFIFKTYIESSSQNTMQTSQYNIYIYTLIDFLTLLNYVQQRTPA